MMKLFRSCIFSENRNVNALSENEKKLFKWGHRFDRGSKGAEVYGMNGSSPS